jgi:hypothetical protein
MFKIMAVWIKRSALAFISSALLMIVLPIVPIASFLLHASIDFFLLAVSIFLILLACLFLAFSPQSEVFHFHFCDLFKGHSRLIAVGGPDFVDYLATLVFCAAMVAFGMLRGQEELVLDLFGLADLPYFHWWHRFVHLLLMRLLRLLIGLQFFLIC